MMPSTDISTTGNVMPTGNWEKRLAQTTSPKLLFPDTTVMMQCDYVTMTVTSVTPELGAAQLHQQSNAPCLDSL